jgi:hypothetical protein
VPLVLSPFGRDVRRFESGASVSERIRTGVLEGPAEVLFLGCSVVQVEPWEENEDPAPWAHWIDYRGTVEHGDKVLEISFWRNGAGEQWGGSLSVELSEIYCIHGDTLDQVVTELEGLTVGLRDLLLLVCR